MGLVNKHQEHYNAVKKYLDNLGLTLVTKLSDIPQRAALAEISEGVYDIDILIAREVILERTTSPVDGRTHPNPDVKLYDCGADYLGIYLTTDKTDKTESQIIPTKAPCVIRCDDIRKQTVYLIPPCKKTSLDGLVKSLRNFVMVPS